MGINLGQGAPSVPGKAILDTPGKILGEIGDFIQNPFSIEPPNTRPQPDFPNGFNIVEIVDGRKLENERVKLLGTWAPKQPFTFGGQHRHAKEFYPGNSEPVVQLFGPEEKDLVIDGTLSAKNLKFPRDHRTVSTELQQQMDAIRIRGNLVELNLGEWRRFGFLIDTEFKMRTLADLDYTLTFLIIGFNPPLNCNQIKTEAAVPFEINKELIREAAAFQETYTNLPDEIPQSLGDLINGAISDVMGAVNAVTGFIDGTLSTVEDVNASINRAIGVVKYGQAEVSRFRRRVGALKFTSLTGTSSIGKYSAFSFANNAIGDSHNLGSLLSSLKSRFDQLRSTVPLARHRIVEGDSLQKIAIKFYNDAGGWEKIYDHNSLSSTDLTTGDVLEIPEL